MYLNYPVMIPRASGRITLRRKEQGTYVQYQVKREYNPTNQQSRVERVEIGVQIPGKPEMMLPNENYLKYFPEGEKNMNEEEKSMVRNYDEERRRCYMLRGFFDVMYYEFQVLSRKNPEGIVNANKVEQLNQVLEPLLEMMKGEEYARFLNLIPDPVEEEGEDGKTALRGLNYGDVGLLMTKFKGGLNQYFQKRI